MKNLEFKVYYFEELNEEAKKKAIEDFRRRGTWKQWDNENLSKYFKERLREYGFYNDVQIEFSLGYCQGDGVAFYGEIYFSKWLKNHQDHFTKKELKRLEWLNNVFGIEVSTTRNSYGYHYSHYNTMDIEVTCDRYIDLRDGDLLDEVLNKVEELLEDEVVELSCDLERIGYEEIEYKNSDEYIIESIIANEYEFTEDGSLY
jgi:hypothetical protein